jgi:hypothetical protein
MLASEEQAERHCSEAASHAALVVAIYGACGYVRSRGRARIACMGVGMGRGRLLLRHVVTMHGKGPTMDVIGEGDEERRSMTALWTVCQLLHRVSDYARGRRNK